MKLTTAIHNSNKEIDHTEDPMWQHLLEIENPQDVLELIELSILYCTRHGIDPIEGLESKYKGEFFQVYIPLVPPGINRMYKVSCVKGKGHFRKSKEAKDWIEAAIMPIRSAANQQGFIVNPRTDRIIVRYWIYNTRHDVDAHVKIVQDTVADTLGFNDRTVIDIKPDRIKTEDGNRGILIEVEKERKFE